MPGFSPYGFYLLKQDGQWTMVQAGQAGTVNQPPEATKHSDHRWTHGLLRQFARRFSNRA